MLKLNALSEQVSKDTVFKTLHTPDRITQYKKEHARVKI